LELYCRHNHFAIIPQAGVPTRVGGAHCRASARSHQVAPLPRRRNFIATRHDTSSDIQLNIGIFRSLYDSLGQAGVRSFAFLNCIL